MKDTPTPREEFEEWLETFYDNSNILSPRSLAWEAWQAAQKELTAARKELEIAIAQRDAIEESRVTISNFYVKTAEQRDKALQKIKNQTERITYLEGATNHATGTPLSKAIEQRDRLAEALERILDYQGRFAEEEPESIAREALKSLIPNK